MLTVDELREVISLHEVLLDGSSGDTDREDLHQAVADLYRRLGGVQARRLAVDAGIEDSWRFADDRDVLLSPRMTQTVVRHLNRVAASCADEQLVARARTAVRLVTTD